MSKERLEEIKKLRETILEENDFLTRCVLANVFVGLGYMDYLIQQAGRVQELESRIADDEHFVVEILEQNKRYRVAIRECIERMDKGGAGTRSFVYETLKKALEGTK